MSKKITQLPAASAAVLAQVIEIVNDPGGTPTSQKLTLTQLKALLDTVLTQAFSGSGDPTTQVPANNAGTYYDYTNKVLWHWNPTLPAWE